MSTKNYLQEYSQKNKLPYPIYKSFSSGKIHDLKWNASVTIEINGKKINFKSRNANNSKTGAEKDAAKAAIDYILEKLPGVDPFVKPVNKKTKESLHVLQDNEPQNIKISSVRLIYMIDLENKPFFTGTIHENCIYMGFINSIHHAVPKYQLWHKCKSDVIDKEVTESKNCKLLYLIDGGIADLADHFMTIFAYPIIEFVTKYQIYPSINIISGDHAGWCTRICLEKILKWRHISNIEINNQPFIH